MRMWWKWGERRNKRFVFNVKFPLWWNSEADWAVSFLAHPTIGQLCSRAGQLVGLMGAREGWASKLPWAYLSPVGVIPPCLHEVNQARVELSMTKQESFVSSWSIQSVGHPVISQFRLSFSCFPKLPFDGLKVLSSRFCLFWKWYGL